MKKKKSNFDFYSNLKNYNPFFIFVFCFFFINSNKNNNKLIKLNNVGHFY